MTEGETERFERYGAELAAAVEAALPAWIRTAVERFIPPGSTSADATATLESDLYAAANQAVSEVGTELRALLARDIDDQWTNPLSILRSAAVYPTRILAARGVAPVARDRHAQRIHPDDTYDLTPANFAEFGPDVHERGINWGAAKAHLHLRRRRRV